MKFNNSLIREMQNKINKCDLVYKQIIFSDLNKKSNEELIDMLHKCRCYLAKYINILQLLLEKMVEEEISRLADYAADSESKQMDFFYDRDDEYGLHGFFSKCKR